LAHKGDSHNLRFAVEATVHPMKYIFAVGKLPVRGKFRIACLMTASDATANLRRIQRYLIAKMKAVEAAKSLQGETAPYGGFFFCFFSARWLHSRVGRSPSFGY
jgi:hypothetical protein